MRSAKGFSMRGRKVLLTFGVISATMVGFFAVSSEAQQQPPTFGPVPPGAVSADGQPDLSKIPDYVGVLSSNGEVAGYVKRSDLFLDLSDHPSSPSDALARNDSRRSMTVYNVNLEVIGQWIDGVGFVASGDPVPDPTPGAFGVKGTQAP
jgi:hypothetical protein